MSAGRSAQPTTEQLRRFFDLSVEMLVIGGDDGRLAVVNPAWEAVLGWTATELLAEPFLSFVHPDDHELTKAEVAAIVSGNNTVSFLNRMRDVQGEYHDIRWSASADETGQIFAAARDVTAYRQAVAQAQQNEELWQAVLRTAADPIILIDEGGIILRVNEATNRLFGHPSEAMVGKNVSMLMPEPYRSEHDSYLRRYLQTGEARIIGIGREVKAQRADGTIFPMSLAVSDVVTNGQKMFTGIIHDLTERHAHEEQLRVANESLESRVADRTTALERSMSELARSNRDLEQFAYIASHDLQAPLRNVRQGLELLDDHLAQTLGTGFDDEAEELRALVVGAVGRMEDLIHGLLSYSRVQQAGEPLDRSVDLNELLSEAVDQLGHDLREARASVVADSLPTVSGDRTQLMQLMQNLLQNAVKYRAADRPPEVRVSASRSDGDWSVSVEDNGVGIDEAQHHRIFDLFRRGHPGYDGVGLGLAICQRIVERHGGRIWVESTPDSGAAFRFTLPSDMPAPDKNQRDENQQTGAAFE